MTALAELRKADRRRLAEAEKLDRLMREPDGLPSVPEPTPLHRRREDADGEGER